MSGSDSETIAASATDARPSPYDSWDTVPWDRVERHAGRLQTRIAEATRDGRVEDARRAERTLARSLDARLLAVRTVTTSKGHDTPGADGVRWDTPSARLAAAKSLTPRGYRAKPLRRVRIPKKGKPGQTRPLGIPTTCDRAMQALYALALDPVAEVTGDRNSFGFRKGRSAQDASQRIFNLMCRKTSHSGCWRGTSGGASTR